jgi:hypothetical protein
VSDESIHARRWQGSQFGITASYDDALERAVPALFELGMRVARSRDLTALSY